MITAAVLVMALGGCMMVGPEGVAVVGGLSALGAGLASIGIPKDSIVRYEKALKAGRFLVIAHGTADEVAKARGILEAAGAIEAETHGA